MRSRRRRPSGRHIIIIGLLCAAWSVAAWSGTTGDVRGVVVDSAGSPLPGVVIGLSGGGVGSSGRGAVSDASGTFHIAALPPGDRYQVRVSFPGFATIVLSDVEIGAGQVTPLRITL